MSAFWDSVIWGAGVIDSTADKADNTELLEALEELVARCDGEEGVRADGTNIHTMRAHAIIAKARGEG